MKSQSRHIIIAGIDTGVGKTIVSAIIAKALQRDYWKPVQCGSLHATDTMQVTTMINDKTITCHPELFVLKAYASPHFAAQREGKTIAQTDIVLPATHNKLIIECAGGLMVPYSKHLLQIDTLKLLDASWILVSRHYLGSINHSLMSIDTMRRKGVHLAGIVFNGHDRSDSESLILNYAQAPLIGHLSDDKRLKNPHTATPLIQAYAKQWKSNLQIF